jgi:hypothetical protein
MTASLTRSQRSHPLMFVLAGGFVAGTLDIAYACLFWALKSGVPVQRILQSVAAGLLGEASFEGGVGNCGIGARAALWDRPVDVGRLLPARAPLAAPLATALPMWRRVWPAAVRDHELHRGASVGCGARIEASAVGRAQYRGTRTLDRYSHRALCPPRPAGMMASALYCAARLGSYLACSRYARHGCQYRLGQPLSRVS